MFSSNNGISPFPQVSPYMNWYPSTSSPFPPSSNCLSENQSPTFSQHEDLLAYCLSTHVPESTNNAPKTSIPQSRPRRQKSVKKEGHSKIFTAKGPRDRRVRLSIDISKKFFGLQDLLGYDKASLTLDWLLTSSKASIEELLRIKKIDSYDNAMCQLCSSSDDESRKRRKRKSSAFFIDKVAEDQVRRAQARERARERTRVKTCLRNLLVCSQQHKLPDLVFPFGFDSLANPTSGEHSLPPPLPAEAGFMFANPRTREVNVHEKVMIRPHFYPHML